MLQEYIALAFILFFLGRLGWQLYKDQISKSQFLMWTLFWFIVGILIIYIHAIDSFTTKLGFSSSGIQLLFYIAVVLLFYWVLRLRLTIEKMSKEITELTRSQALANKNSNHN